MKHSLKVTISLIVLFLLAQVIGLLVVNQYIDHQKTTETKEISYKPLPYDLERPEIKNQSYSFLYLSAAIITGTLLILILIRFNKVFIWKFWFFATIWVTLSVAFAAFISSFAAAMIALAFSLLRLYKPNFFVQNVSEVFVYGGLAAIFVPMMNMFAAFALLIVISVYDFIAVNKTKHMIKLANFQSSSKVFAGLLINYGKEKTQKQKYRQDTGAKSEKRVAVLGGGDIGFTLLFAGVVMQELMLKEAVIFGFLKTLVIPLFASIALLMLLVKGKKDKFYPAMPALSAACFLGYLVVWII
ncbi:hypothetical protein HYS31_02380 [Candidatus Woesearchaeota archaeon]|nr:hypothetical protein [Candidatus Woesearchaeota archaeon]